MLPRPARPIYRTGAVVFGVIEIIILIKQKIVGLIIHYFQTITKKQVIKAKSEGKEAHDEG